METEWRPFSSVFSISKNRKSFYLFHRNNFDIFKIHEGAGRDY